MVIASLPKGEGGLEVALSNWQTERRIELQFVEIILLATDSGLLSHVIFQRSRYASNLT
jgi:hypothetical protein